MDWYFSRESDDLIVPNDQETMENPFTEDRLSEDEWFQWGVTKSENFGAPDKYSAKLTAEESNFNRQSVYIKVSKKHPVYEGEESSTSSACGELSLTDCSRRISEVPWQGRPDFQLQMGDIFLNSLLEGDSFPFQSLQLLPDSINRPLSFENLLADMLTDPHSLVKEPAMGISSTYLKPSYPPSPDVISQGWDEAADSSHSCLMPYESKISQGLCPTKDPVVALVVPGEIDVSNDGKEVAAAVYEHKCLESTVLQDLEDVMIQLNDKMRIRFRDSLYRLAQSSKQQHTIDQNRSANFIFDRLLSAEVNCDSSRLETPKCAESKTNAIDRTVANLMFNRLNCGPPDLSCPGLLHNDESPAAYGSHNSLNQPSLPPYSSIQTSLLCDVHVPFSVKVNSNSHSVPETLSEYLSDMNMEVDSADMGGQFSMN